MAILRETIHHALGTFGRGAELPDDHPLVVAVPEFFDGIGEGNPVADRSVITADAKPGRSRRTSPA